MIAMIASHLVSGLSYSRQHTSRATNVPCSVYERGYLISPKTFEKTLATSATLYSSNCFLLRLYWFRLVSRQFQIHAILPGQDSLDDVGTV